MTDQEGGASTVEKCRSVGRRALLPMVVLLASLATLAPYVAAAPASLAGTLCPASVHDKYVTSNPWNLFDTRVYPTWHPQRDPETGCYFGHEHGSDPREYLGAFEVPGAPQWKGPPFGVAAYHDGMAENHEGFKVYVVQDDGAGHSWLFLIHQGSGGPARVCTRMHEVQVYAKPTGTHTSGGAALDFMADFGVSEDNTGVTPYACNPAQVANNHASRLIPRADLDQFAYEPWKFDLAGTGLNLSSIVTFNTRNIQRVCQNQACSSQQSSWTYSYGCSCYVQTSGAQRFIQVGAGCGDGCGYPLTLAAGHGAFCTDAMGRNAHPGSCTGTALDQITQYIEPGFAAMFPWRGANAKFAQQAIDGPYVLTDFNGPESDNDLDGMIGVPN